MHVLLILGHPRTDSLCGSLARAYREGATEAGMEVRELELATLDFEHDVETVEPTDQHTERDLARAQQQIAWADHLVFVYPNWWGTMPALLKAFFDRVFTPGFAFSFYEDGEGAGHEELLRGRTAELIVTMDMPAWVYRWIYRQPGVNAIKRNTLGYAGIRTTRVTTFGPVEDSTPDERERWLEKATQLGRKLQNGPESQTGRLKRRLGTAIQALRLQFYPMSWVAYTIGALAAGSSAALTTAVYWIGFGFLFFLEAATVLTNEYFDYETDRQNTFASPFTGGSRVLVEERVGFRELRFGVGLTLGLASLFGLIVLVVGAGSALVMAGLMGVLAVLALGYTVPPLELSYRTVGELDVATTHSIGVMLCGFVFAGGSVTDSTPWLLSAPLFLATIPSITLAGVPDYEADSAAGKQTIAVRFGVDRAVTVASVTAVLAALVAVLWQLFGLVPDAYSPYIYLSLLHAVGLVWLLRTRVDAESAPTRIDGLMAASLSYVLWFGVVPLVGLL